MEVVVPAAGLSTRFPDTKPKYLLYDYRGEMMLKNALRPFLDKGHNIYVGILKEHDEKFMAKAYINHEIPEAKVIILKERTKGPADTVYQIIKESGLKYSTELFIKDCDSFFDHDIRTGNYVCVSRIQNHEVLKKLASKSFVVANDQGLIQTIQEKSVISDTFCVGGYHFATAITFMVGYEEVGSVQSEVYVSDVIQHALNRNNIFFEQEVENYVDVGTLSDWLEYNDKPTIFCDIDGTLIKAQSRLGPNSFGQVPEVLPEAYKAIKQRYDAGCQIVFTTARPVEYHEVTYNMLKNLGFDNFQLISGLHNASRILINDFNQGNPYPRATAINVKRDDDTLGHYL